MSANPRKIRKAAILVASLDRDAADIVMNQMTPLEARLVRRAMVELGSPDPVEQNDVIEDFFRTAPRVHRDDLEGIELVDDVFPSKSTSRQKARDESKSAQPLGFLKDAAAESLAPLLERERPQTIAVVLSHVSAKAAAELLGRMPAAVQIEVTHCMLELDRIEAAALTALEEGVATWLRMHAQVQEHQGQSPIASRDRLEEILAIASSETRENMLAALPAFDSTPEVATTDPNEPETTIAHNPPAPASDVKPRIVPARMSSELNFQKFCLFDPVDAAEIVSAAYPEVAALALVCADETFTERVLQHMPLAEANQIRANLQDLGPTSLADVELAQNEIVRLAEHRRQVKKRTSAGTSSRLSVVG
ncbi:MAG: hypothetical protein MI757_22975 [Pirellulales bacterium]|nr:hypothetical protein [Pirellulales bacterium]